MTHASFRPSHKMTAEIQVPEQARRVGLIYAGGTIEAIPGAHGLHENGSGELDLLSYFLRKRPNARELLAPAAPKVALRVVSENMSHGGRDWENLATCVCERINQGIPGVVITHGTDTMEYTAAALSFLLHQVTVPIILTGSNYPITDTRSENDAIDNLYDALLFGTKSHLSGVYVVFHHCVYKGTRVKKMTDWASGRGSFSSMSFPAIAKIENEEVIPLIESELGEKENTSCTNRRFRWPAPPREPDGGFVAQGVGFLSIRPDCLEDLECLVERPGQKAILLELYDSGTAPTSGAGKFSILPAIEKAKEAGILFFATSRSASRNKMSVYESSNELRGAGVIPLFDMTTTAAWVKLRWVLSQTENPAEIRKSMVTDRAGELSQTIP